MPLITRTLIKTALGYAFLGLALSAVWMINLVWPIYALLGYIQPTAIHMIVVGWLTQLIFGVVLWMFPPWSKAQPRGPQAASWSCYVLLNTGLVLRLIAEPLNAYHGSPTLGWLLVASAICQVGAIWIFIGLVWRRVRGKSGGR